MRYVRYSVKYGGNGLYGLTELTLFRYTDSICKNFVGSNDVLQGRLCNFGYFSGKKVRFFRARSQVFNNKRSFFWQNGNEITDLTNNHKI